jgi:hypothetical protein
MMLAMLFGSFSMVLSTTAFAKGPKCPCYKDKDLEKLVKKGYEVTSVDNGEPTYRQVILENPLEPDYGQKGKRDTSLFLWEQHDGEWASCHTYEYQLKWKGEPFTNKGKSKDMREGIPLGDPNEIDCKSILDNFIAGLE